jgi:voltage-gated potassium channel
MPSTSNSTTNADCRRVARLHKFLGFLNDVLLIPMFTLLLLEISTSLASKEAQFFGVTNLLFCTTFGAEWVLGLAIAEDRKRYLFQPEKIADLVSSIPFGHFFQSIRLVRLVRVVRVFRAVWRTKQYKGPSTRILRVLAVVVATVGAGALAMRVVEPDLVPSLQDALWWALTTVTTVGYYEEFPQTGGGRIVTALLCTCGVGVFGYVAGFLSTIIEDPEEQELLLICNRLEAKIDGLSREVAELKGEAR